jgi:ribosomal-protein-alanine N-acetyltransferase
MSIDPSFQPIVINDEIALTELRQGDREALVRYLNDEQIHGMTLRIPHPYTADDADRFLALVDAQAGEYGRPLHFAIRKSGEFVGGFGFEGMQPDQPHRAEIGYWLARPFWGHGIMTAVVGGVCQFALENYSLDRIAAYVFDTNVASARVLEKNGFVLEGILRKHHIKNGKFIDARLYARLK